MAATVWLKPLNSGSWQPVGTVSDAGVWHEGLNLVSDQWGPKSASFTLKRQPRTSFPDLLARTQVAVEVGGVRVWRGRVKDTPDQSGAVRQITVQCVGGQAILDDDTLERTLVHTRLADYKDERTTLSTVLSSATQAWNVGNQDGAITIGLQNGAIVGPGTYGGVVLDLGPGNTAKRVVVTVETSGGSAAVSFKCRGTDAPEATAAAFEDLFVATLSAYGAGPVTSRGTFATARRYVHLYLADTSGAGFTAATDLWVKIRAVQVFADTAYESGDASILDARTIIVDALTRATTGLSADMAGIGAPSFAFPNFAPDTPRSPRELIAAANAPISQWWFRIDENLRAQYQARPTTPIIELGAWLGSASDNAASNTDEGITTKVTVRGQSADGTPVRSTGTQTGTIVDRQGGVSAKTLDASYMLTTVLADKLRDAYLVSHRVSPFKGQDTVGLNGARRAATGGTAHPAHLLLLTGQLARRTDLIDPDTGFLGRTAVIDQVTYRDDDCEADIDLDNTRRDFEALNERVGLLAPV